MARLLLILVSMLSIFKGVDSACECYEPHDYVGKTAPISNAYDPNTFQACNKICSYKAYSGDDNYIWTHLTLQWGVTEKSNGLVQIFDGPVETDTPLITVREGESVLDGSAKSKIKSKSATIVIKYSQVGNESDVFYGSIRAIPKVDHL